MNNILQELLDFHDFQNSKYIEKVVQSIIDKMTNKFGQPESGRNRTVFKGKTIVFKVPHNSYGIHDNEYEYRTFKSSPNNDKLARCKLVHINDIPILLMIKVDTNIPLKNLPDWSKFYDCFQVGKNKKGKYKAYDYGFN